MRTGEKEGHRHTGEAQVPRPRAPGFGGMVPSVRRHRYFEPEEVGGVLVDPGERTARAASCSARPACEEHVDLALETGW